MKDGTVARSRSVYLDIVKGFAMICVVFGHCIQFGSGREFLSNTLFFDNIVFKTIYSFHMPLFMLVSGFLFAYSSEKRTWNEQLKRQATSLLIPIAIWALVPFASEIAMLADSNQYIGLLEALKTYLFVTLNNLWFLWAVFWCSAVVIIVRQFFNDSKRVYAFGFLLTFFIPDTLGLYLYKFMYPFFIAGYFFNKGNCITKLQKIVANSLTIWLFAVFFLLLLSFYDRDSYIYTTGYSLIRGTPMRQLKIDMYRFFIGFAGSALVLLLIHRILPVLHGEIKRIVGYFGTNSFGIYIISGYLFSYFVPKMTASLPRINYVVTIMETMLVLLVSHFCVKWIQKNKLLCKLLFGGRGVH